MKRTVRIFLILLGLLTIQLSCNLPVRNLGPVSLPGRPTIPDLATRLDASIWTGWLRKLSGAEPVQVGSKKVVIATRYNYAMFTGQENAQAIDFVLEQVRQWVPDSQIQVEEYPYQDAERTYTWKNLVVTLPGTTRSNDVVVLSAHLDSVVVKQGNALQAAPGADDNATGAGTLLEAARLLSRYRFERTIRLIWFSGEESGEAGSSAYIQQHKTGDITAMTNLDMFGYDSDNDRCFELHVGTLPGSDGVGKAFVQTIQEQGLNLHYDYLTTQATDRSDHAPFWRAGVPAISVIENFFDNKLPGGCQGVDGNPYYHRPGDTLDKLNIPFAFDIAKASIITTARLAGPLD